MMGGSRRALSLAAFFLSIALLAGGLVLYEAVRVAPDSPQEVAYLILLALAVIPLSVLVAVSAVYLLVPRNPFPRALPDEWPTVAVAYCVYNDTLPEAIAASLANLEYPRAQVFLLSDSTAAAVRAMEAALPSAVRVFRRPTRRGGKAGALNDWLRGEGRSFDYVVPMDADCLLARGALRELVSIAEHPANQDYVAFQSLMEVHPSLAPTAFSRTMGRGVKWGCRILPLASQELFGQAMYWGSNALFRRERLVDAGAFVEEHICEDFAVTARLDGAGERVALVDLYNFEGFPPDALSFRVRAVRWCKANATVGPFIRRFRPTGAVWWGLAVPLMFYLMAPVLLSMLVLTLVAPPDVGHRVTSTTVGLLLLGFIFFHRLLVVPPTLHAWRAFTLTLALETAVVLGLGLRITWALIESALRTPSWSPSRKEAMALTGARAVRESLPELSFGILIVALIVAFQPPAEYALLASVWIVSFLATPVVLWSSAMRGTGVDGRTRPNVSPVVSP